MKNLERRGKIKWFDAKKGYGFLTSEDGSEELFVHFSNIEKDAFQSMIEGKTVTYEIAGGCKGPQAINVRCQRR